MSSKFLDERGLLCKVILSDVPFPIHELFVISGVPLGMVRGNHAHKVVHQYLICLDGEVRVTITNMNRKTREVALMPDGPELHIPPRVWASQTYLALNTRLLVFTSGEYNPGEYFQNLDDFYESFKEDDPVSQAVTF